MELKNNKDNKIKIKFLLENKNIWSIYNCQQIWIGINEIDDMSKRIRIKYLLFV